MIDWITYDGDARDHSLNSQNIHPAVNRNAMHYLLVFLLFLRARVNWPVEISYTFRGARRISQNVSTRQLTRNGACFLFFFAGRCQGRAGA
jgi:hypothetical protein